MGEAARRKTSGNYPEKTPSARILTSVGPDRRPEVFCNIGHKAARRIQLERLYPGVIVINA